MAPLLVCQPVTAVEQLLAGQPVIGYVTGLPADQKVRHDVRVTLSSPSVFVFHRIRFNSMLSQCVNVETHAGLEAATENFLPSPVRCSPSQPANRPTVVLLFRAAGKIPFVCLSICQKCRKMLVYFLRSFCQPEMSAHVLLGTAPFDTCVSHPLMFPTVTSCPVDPPPR